MFSRTTVASIRLTGFAEIVMTPVLVSCDHPCRVIYSSPSDNASTVSTSVNRQYKIRAFKIQIATKPLPTYSLKCGPYSTKRYFAYGMLKSNALDGIVIS